MTYKNAVRTSQETYYVSATKNNRLMLFRETVTLYCGNHTEYISTLSGYDAQFQYVKAGGTYSNHLALRINDLFFVRSLIEQMILLDLETKIWREVFSVQLFWPSLGFDFTSSYSSVNFLTVCVYYRSQR
jgi:hypothetical protein